MYRTFIAVVDASRARIFIQERTDGVEGLSESMVELEDLVNPARRLRTSELFSEPRRGSGRVGPLHYGFDDGRGAHLDELDAGFAHAVVGALAAQLDAKPSQRLILCASPRMLGQLRAALDGLRQPTLTIDELPRDLVKLTPTKLRDHLQSCGLLPARPHPIQARQ